MQIKQTICGVDVEFHQAPFHQTNTDISFKQGDVEIRVRDIDTNKDYVPLFESMHARRTHKYGETTFSWNGDDLEVSQGDKKITLKNIAAEEVGFGELKTQYDVLCMLAFGRCIDPY